MPNNRFQAEPLVPGHDPIPSTPPTGGFDSPEVLPLLEAIFLGLHFRDHITANEQAHFERLAPPAGYLMMTLGERLLTHGELPPQVLEGLSPAIMHGSDAVFTHRCRIRDHDLAQGVIHTARVGAIGERDITLGVCQPDHHRERPRQVERFSRLIATARTALRAASDVALALESRLPDNLPHLLVNRASGRIVTASESICRELGSDSALLNDAEYSQMASRLGNLFRTRATRMENVAIADMNLAVVTFLPERRINNAGNTAAASRLVDALRVKIAAITASADNLKRVRGVDETGATRSDIEIISSQTDELHKLINRFNTEISECQDVSQHRLSGRITYKEVVQHSNPVERMQRGKPEHGQNR